jgi:predicted extracellular nuclease
MRFKNLPLIICFTLAQVICSSWLYAQERNLTGKVNDETGEPIPGATILVKGTNRGTATDVDGSFSIMAAPSDVLAISYVGYLSREIEVGNQTTTTANTTAITGSLPNATFHSKINMVMTNGSAMHDHEIYNFKLATMSNPNNTTSVFNGTATITMRQGPVENVPVSIKRIDNNVISIWADPAMINNHFGNTPIFGTIEKLLRAEK